MEITAVYRDEVRARIAGRHVVASVSGGKDSAAMSLWLRELEIEHSRTFMDTGWEHPSTYAYLRGELTDVIGPIQEIRGLVTMPDLIRQKTGFPGGKTRFCTQELKIKPMLQHLSSIMDGGVDVVNAVGVRRQESAERADATEWEWMDDFDCEMWRPLVEWSVEDIVAIHRRHGLRPNPLYLKGFSRVGCFPCIHANKGEIALVAKLEPARIDEIRALEAEVGAKSNADPKPAFFTLRDRAGKKHRTPIDEVVTWSRTSYGGRQLEMLATDPADIGCMRWGLCEASSPKDEP